MPVYRRSDLRYTNLDINVTEPNDWAENGVGLRYSHAYGFGLMDAGKMTRMAKDWETVPDQKKCTTPEKILDEPVVIGPQQEQTISIDAGLCEKINHQSNLQMTKNFLE